MPHKSGMPVLSELSAETPEARPRPGARTADQAPWQRHGDRNPRQPLVVSFRRVRPERTIQRANAAVLDFSHAPPHRPQDRLRLQGPARGGGQPRPPDPFSQRLGRTLLKHGGISLFELSKFAAGVVETEEQRWLKFFKDGERLDADQLPDWMQTTEMRQAMSTVKQFSEKERAYDAYQARQNYLRVQSSIHRHQQELEEALAQERAAREAERLAREAERLAKEAERQAKESALQEKDAALAEIARLRALLRSERP